MMRRKSLFLVFFTYFSLTSSQNFVTIPSSSSSFSSSSSSSSSRSLTKFNSALLALGGLGGGFMVYWFGYRKLQSKTSKLQVENSDLLEYIKLQTEYHQLQEKGWKDQMSSLELAYKELYQDSLERDYEEFKAPDANHDEIITLDEFESYITKYLQSFPELTENDFPKFREFDSNENGEVTFSEWRGYLKQQKRSKPSIDSELKTQKKSSSTNSLFSSE